jgi:predicted amidophosphoribosyltransferase
LTEHLPVLYSLYRFAWQGMDFIFPPRCGGCDKFGVRWCDDCKASLVEITPAFCDICGLPQAQAGVCDKCNARKPVYKELRAWLAFDGAIRKALHKVKYRRDFGMGEQLAFEILPFVKKLN